METNPSNMNRFGQWFSESLTVKLMTIFAMIILLLIPTFLLLDLVRERQDRQQEVIHEIGNSWSSAQRISGPLLVLPYKTFAKIQVGEREILEEKLAYAYILPNQTQYYTDTKSENLSRGIFQAAVYQTKMISEGDFSAVDLNKLGIDSKQLQLDKARVLVGLGDLKGLQQSPVLYLGQQQFGTENGHIEMGLSENNLIFDTPLADVDWKNLSFKYELNLKGSEYLEFMPLANTTEVEAIGNWASPKFSGDYLPENRETTENQYKAKWKVLQFSRNIPQQWTSEEWSPTQLDQAVNQAGKFKIEFIQSSDHYQKTERSMKYAILIISLTFVALFFTEITTKKRVPIIQYVLIGAAMIVFYSLLLSLSEQIQFNFAYGLSALATVLLIGTFISTLLGSFKPALLFSAILSTFYVFIFITLQLQDYALLVGSIGLFITVAFLMYFSSRINWNNTN